MNQLPKLETQLEQGYFIPTFESIAQMIQLLSELNGETTDEPGTNE